MSRENENLVGTIAGNVRRLRQRRGWSQEELADICELHRTYIGSIERAERNITVKTLSRLASALECDVAELLRARKA